MTIATVKKVATDFLTREEPGVLALKGAWGVGKTHFWDSLVKELGDKINPTQYSYVSLFGIASKRELSIALYASVQDLKASQPKTSTGIRRYCDSVWSKAKVAGAWCTRFLAKFGKYSPFSDIPWVKNLPRSFEAFVSHRIMKAVICLDDFERLEEKSLTPEELMGFINELKEKKDCKVVLIFNEARLGDKQNCYDTYREKVIDMELLYAPTAQESAMIAVPPGTLGREIIEECAAKLNVTNIRVLRKMVRLSRLMYAVARALDPAVMEQAVRTLVLLAWCYYEKNKDKPTLEFVLGRNPYSSLLNKNADSEKDPQLEKWETLLRNYGFALADELDLSIKTIIEHGYLEDSGFEEKAQELNTKILNGQNKADLDTVWEPLNHSFDDNLDEFVEIVRAKFDKYVDFVNLNLLNSLVLILRELNQGPLADALITEYFAARENDHHAFNLKSLPNVLRPTDTTLLEHCLALQAKMHAPLTLDAAIRHFMTSNSWDDAQMKPLRDATEEEFYNCFKQHKGEDLTDFIRNCQRYAGIQGNEAIAPKVHRALVRIGKENAINRFRVVHRFGITEEDLDKTS